MIIEVIHAGHVVHRQPLGLQPLTIGRGPDNALVLRDPGVSTHHALICRDGSALLLRDLGSTNGTTLDGALVSGPQPLRAGQVLRLGPRATLRLVAGGDGALPDLLLESTDGPLAWPVTPPRFSVPDTDATIHLQPGGIQLQEAGVWRALRLDVPFSLGARGFVLRVLSAPAQTARPTEATLPYRLSVDLARSRAQLRSPGATVQITASTQVALLHVLAEAHARGEHNVDDDTLIRAVWGRAGLRQHVNNLNVIIHRLRKKVEEHGLSRDFIERGAGHTRLRIAAVEPA